VRKATPHFRDDRMDEERGAVEVSLKNLRRLVANGEKVCSLYARLNGVPVCFCSGISDLATGFAVGRDAAMKVNGTRRVPYTAEIENVPTRVLIRSKTCLQTPRGRVAMRQTDRPIGRSVAPEGRVVWRRRSTGARGGRSCPTCPAFHCSRLDGRSHCGMDFALPLRGVPNDSALDFRHCCRITRRRVLLGPEVLAKPLEGHQINLEAPGAHRQPETRL
jgi:hypothetical protein